MSMDFGYEQEGNCISMQGILSKQQKTMKMWVDRWYVLKDKFLYYFKLAKTNDGPADGLPKDADFIQDCTIKNEAVESEKQKGRFCFSITFPTEIKKKKLLWTKDFETRERWVTALREAA